MHTQLHRHGFAYNQSLTNRDGIGCIDALCVLSAWALSANCSITKEILNQGVPTNPISQVSFSHTVGSVSKKNERLRPLSKSFRDSKSRPEVVRMLFVILNQYIVLEVVS